jgi:hypothetical protein
MKNINEELLRMKFLLDYRKGRVISEQNYKITTTSQKVQGGTKETERKELKFEKSFVANYAPNDDDPKGFIKTVYDTFVEEMSKQNPENKPLKVTYVRVDGTASNSWSGNKVSVGGKQMPTSWTCYDLENDRVTKAPANVVESQPNDSGYKSNKDLAQRRTNKFFEEFSNMISKNNGITTNTPNKYLISNVVNTGGVIDSARDQSKFPLPGQSMTLRMSFFFAEETVRFKFIPGSEMKPVATSTYWCDGTAGDGGDIGLQGVKQYCYKNNLPQWPKELPSNAGKNDKQPNTKDSFNTVEHNIIYMYQNVTANATWYFSWNGGKIVSITKDAKNNYGATSPTTGRLQIVKGSGQVLGNQELMKELKDSMNFPKMKTDGTESGDSYRQSYNLYVEPYLTETRETAPVPQPYNKIEKKDTGLNKTIKRK